MTQDHMLGMDIPMHLSRNVKKAISKRKKHQFNKKALKFPLAGR
jgi:hypothetical protein